VLGGLSRNPEPLCASWTTKTHVANGDAAGDNVFCFRLIFIYLFILHVGTWSRDSDSRWPDFKSHNKCLIYCERLGHEISRRPFRKQIKCLERGRTSNPKAMPSSPIEQVQKTRGECGTAVPSVAKSKSNCLLHDALPPCGHGGYLCRKDEPSWLRQISTSEVGASCRQVESGRRCSVHCASSPYWTASPRRMLTCRIG